MNTSPVELGAVFEAQGSTDLVRVIAFDESMVMYDAWWPHTESWGMSTLHGSFSYYRLSRLYFESHLKYLKTEPYSEQEQKVHRPDLPFGFAQRSQLSWYEPWHELTRAEVPGPVLKTPAVFLEPFGPRDGSKPAILVHAANGESFTEHEVLNLAHAIQAPHLGEARLTSGVGIYRSGIKKRLPSYYIWGFRSRYRSKMDATSQDTP